MWGLYKFTQGLYIMKKIKLYVITGLQVQYKALLFNKHPITILFHIDPSSQYKIMKVGYEIPRFHGILVLC